MDRGLVIFCSVAAILSFVIIALSEKGGMEEARRFGDKHELWLAKMVYGLCWAIALGVMLTFGVFSKPTLVIANVPVTTQMSYLPSQFRTVVGADVEIKSPEPFEGVCLAMSSLNIDNATGKVDRTRKYGCTPQELRAMV